MQLKLVAETGCTISSPIEDEIGTYYTRICTGSNNSSKWYLPKIADAAIAALFVASSDGQSSYYTRQCFKYDLTSKMFALDTTKITEDAGYEIVINTNTSKAVSPPSLTPLGGG